MRRLHTAYKTNDTGNISEHCTLHTHQQWRRHNKPCSCPVWWGQGKVRTVKVGVVDPREQVEHRPPNDDPHDAEPDPPARQVVAVAGQ